MGSVSRASWIAAASVGAVEALKDQGGLCRWNYALRSLHHNSKNNMGSFSQAKKKGFSSSSSSSSSLCSSIVGRDEAEKAKRSEESLRKVMYLSCWGPN